MRKHKTPTKGRFVKLDAGFCRFSIFTGPGFLDLGFEDACEFDGSAEALRRGEGVAA